MSGAANGRQDIGHLKNYLQLQVDFSNATWNTVATHEIFTVTGLVRIQLIPEVTQTLNGGAAATIRLGTEVNAGIFIAATGFAAITAGSMFLTATPLTDFANTSLIDRVMNGSDIGYEILVNAMTAGIIKFHLYWEPLDQNTPGSVTVGAGGTL